MRRPSPGFSGCPSKTAPRQELPTNCLVGIARDPHKIRTAHQIAEDLAWAENMRKKGLSWDVSWWSVEKDAQVPRLENLPPRQKLHGTHAGHLWPLPPGAAEWEKAIAGQIYQLT